ncbi:transcription elongation factor GreA [Geovibrio ferrireducens]|uniref:transcription elongation factor GreA n=1 Tax=Geovibrio ferrireducens TaxID=46201 RepID=UPI00224639EC|nr:transcription elongation factor GreA [Geovibrio ferrireducens]
MERIPITKEGFQKIKKELERLKTTERKEAVEAIAEARSHGDLSENAEYDAAKERQGMIEARIAELEGKIGRFDVIDISSLSSDKVIFGATVTVENVDTEERKTYKIVGPDEADISSGTISILSPLSRALVNKKVGDETIVQAPGGEIEYEIIEISFK